MKHTEEQMREALEWMKEFSRPFYPHNRNGEQPRVTILVEAITELVELRAERSALWEPTRQENVQFRTVLGRLYDWVHIFGAALCPGRYADTFGEGIREAKRQVAEILRTEEIKSSDA